MSFKYIEHKHYFDTPKNSGNMALFSFFWEKKKLFDYEIQPIKR